MNRSISLKSDADSEAGSTNETRQRCRIIETAERLFREIGFQKTTVGDIARELKMSPANVYRFFSSKAHIHEAVGQQVMSEQERGARAIATGQDLARDRLRALMQYLAQMNEERFLSDRKLHEMVEVALKEDWPIIHQHIERIREIIAAIIAHGIETGEFAPVDPDLAAGLVQAACVSFHHPQLMFKEPETPTLDQMLDFCMKALARSE